MKKLVLALILVAVPLRADTYNFFFPQKKKSEPSKVEEAVPVPAPAPSFVVAPAPLESNPKWEFGISVIATEKGREVAYPESNYQASGVALSWGYRFVPLLTVKGFTGIYRKPNDLAGPYTLLLGGEVSVHPPRGEWKNVSFVEFHFNAGLSNFGPENRILPHVGLAMFGNFTRLWALSFGYRFNQATTFGELSSVVYL